MAKRKRPRAPQPDPATDTPQPSPEPAAKLLLADIVLRGAGKAMHETLEQRMLVARYDPASARTRVDGRAMLTSMGLYGASKLASRSPLGLAAVVGGLVLKALYDRGKARQLAQREADTAQD